MQPFCSCIGTGMVGKMRMWGYQISHCVGIKCPLSTWICWLIFASTVSANKRISVARSTRYKKYPIHPPNFNRKWSIPLWLVSGTFPLDDYRIHIQSWFLDGISVKFWTLNFRGERPHRHPVPVWMEHSFCAHLCVRRFPEFSTVFMFFQKIHIADCLSFLPSHQPKFSPKRTKLKLNPTSHFASLRSKHRLLGKKPIFC